MWKKIPTNVSAAGIFIFSNQKLQHSTANTALIYAPTPPQKTIDLVTVQPQAHQLPANIAIGTQV